MYEATKPQAEGAGVSRPRRIGLAPRAFRGGQVQERIFRHRAEQLFTDIRLLQMYKANLPQIRAVLKRWGKLGTHIAYPDFEESATR